ncbi:MAG: hypothetical protein HYR84_06690 [Planctomycetes bacterium]|nr:hypothetical protein [Planctomycetota bacterium]
MPWPQAKEFQDAVLNPQASFLDADLREACVVCDANGLSIPASGAFRWQGERLSHRHRPGGALDPQSRPAPERSVAMSEDGRWIATADEKQNAKVWEITYSEKPLAAAAPGATNPERQRGDRTALCYPLARARG